MAGRRRKPVDLVIYDDKSHRSKRELAARKVAEDAGKQIGDATLACPEEVKRDPVARAAWDRVIKISKKTQSEYLRSGDADALGHYCLLYAEWHDLVEKREIVTQVVFAGTDWEGVLKTLLRLDASIDGKVSRMAALGDRLFLNPLSRLKHTGARKENAPVAANPLAKFGMGGV